MEAKKETCDVCKVEFPAQEMIKCSRSDKSKGCGLIRDEGCIRSHKDGCEVNEEISRDKFERILGYRNRRDDG